jgi:hypothetical protein
MPTDGNSVVNTVASISMAVSLRNIVISVEVVGDAEGRESLQSLCLGDWDFTTISPYPPKVGPFGHLTLGDAARLARSCPPRRRNHAPFRA